MEELPAAQIPSAELSALTLQTYGSELAALEVPLGELAQVLWARECKKDDKTASTGLATLNASPAQERKPWIQETSAASRLDIR